MTLRDKLKEALNLLWEVEWRARIRKGIPRLSDLRRRRTGGVR